jgi:hypothetical protein
VSADRADRADQLAAIAIELVGRVRDDEPSAVHRWLSAVVADNDMMALAVILAAAVPVDQPWSHLTAWTWLREYGDGRPDTAEKIALRRAALDQALNADPRERFRRGAAWEAA